MPETDSYTRMYLDRYTDFQQAAKHVTRFEREPLARYKHRLQSAVVRKWMQPGKCLDVPVGTGRFALIAAERQDVHLVGMDMTPTFLHFCREQLHLDIPLARADIHHIPIESGSMDMVLCIHVLPSLPRYRTILEECMRVLKPGGRLIFNIGSAECQNSALYRFLGRAPDRAQFDGVPVYYAELTRLFLGWGGIVDYYRHDWMTSIGHLHPRISRGIQWILQRRLHIWLARLELTFKGLFPKWLCSQHFLVVERQR